MLEIDWNAKCNAGSLHRELFSRASGQTPADSRTQSPDLLTFCRRMYPGFQTGPHHAAIAQSLEAVERGDITRLMISCPPRHGKSLETSVLFPPWYLGRNPNNRLIACSYSFPLARTFSRQARNVIASPDYQAIFPTIQLASDARSVDNWELSAPYRGGYVAAGVGGSITGKGSHILLLDDPVKDAEAASSQTILDSIWEWYTQTAYTRLEGHGAIILVMTRWSEGDLAGLLLDAMATNPDADQWHVVRLPALAEDGDQLGRQIDEPLWPQKYDRRALERIRTNIGPRAFAALYQQRPSPAEGSIFKREWWQRYSVFDRTQAREVIQVWDTAFQAKESADYSVCSTWARLENRVYVLDVFRARLEFPELKRKAKDLYEKWRPHAVIIEDKASGQSLIQELRNETSLPVIPFKIAGTDKVARANAVTPYVEAGRVYLPESAPWVDSWIEEHAAFDAGAHDDQVDTTSMALLRLFGAGDGLPYARVRDNPDARAVILGKASPYPRESDPVAKALGNEPLSDEDRIKKRLAAYYGSPDAE